MAEITIRGPIFDGRAEHEISTACHEAQRGLGEVALLNVRAGTVAFRHPSGRFTSRLDVRHYRKASVVAAPLIYGPWLEGTGSKNRSARFPGYRLWAVAALRVHAIARPFVEAVLGPAIVRSGGR